MKIVAAVLIALAAPAAPPPEAGGLLIGLFALSIDHGATGAGRTVWAIHQCDFGGMRCPRLVGDYPTSDACWAAVRERTGGPPSTMICQKALGVATPRPAQPAR